MAEKLTGHRPVHILTALIMAEARGEPYDGRLAVGWTVRNRVYDKRWPGNYEDVILQPYQFSCTNPKDSNYQVLMKSLLPSENGNLENMIYRECLGIAFLVIGNWRRDITEGANHYHASWMKEYPKWADKDKITYRIGGHIFYKL